ncbi:YkgJ family cysteine cluster protein [Luteimonas sp. RD2P54]|uniref:YkgJ family cysteine cluster protein n=1 Tax=Luteimonas endophytica TaxID=3042023 RepID=A0ABT6J6L3_9GAMM|nr:YkgJ family cysteine cluster protein [Luteimonas endophytica]MDH5822476.1 YkgJ family cysteine cluster protein [Luteimonas endophytica]
MSHPCLSCGACCAWFRVGFHWSEAAPELGGTVPAELTETLDAHRLAMRGTWARQPRCVALDAEIGVRSRCTIHPLRPSVCREVPASWEHGAASPQCDRARLAHGLPLLTAADWRTPATVLVAVVPDDAAATPAPAAGEAVIQPPPH